MKQLFCDAKRLLLVCKKTALTSQKGSFDKLKRLLWQTKMTALTKPKGSFDKPRELLLKSDGLPPADRRAALGAPQPEDESLGRPPVKKTDNICRKEVKSLSLQRILKIYLLTLFD